ncbi:T9SS type A sorting domain-containing protein [Psychroserpens mesophilus]|uniref:T9SS type A sorting domain-containing protein n=1 Tax=Psychroserpens mesophilus TaxID=325473 RepID=UPI0005914AB5|nr:T9SS type A sorting domain-containing protein [Psychroserpens mesophilus]
MKKITLLTFLLTSFVMFGQSSLPIDFENGTTTASFEFGGLGFANIANPDPSGINTSSRVLEVVKPAGAEWFGGFGYETPGSAFIDLANGEAFTLKIWSTKANLKLRFQIQIGLSGEPTYNRDVIVSDANTWTEVTFDFSNQAGLTGTEQYSTLVIQPDYDPACEGPGCPTLAVGGTYYIDDIVQVGAPEPTCTDGIQNGNETGVDCGGPDCPACPPSCTDGIQNGNETGVDCGGPDCPECPAPDPTVGPVNFGSTGNDMYIYSELSGNANSSDFAGFNLVDFAGGTQLSQPDLSGDTVLRVDNLDFFGSGLGEVFNATSTYSFVHLNYYATSSTAFNFSLVDQSLSATICCGNPEEPFYRFGSGGDAPLVTGQWVSVFIPLSHFANFPALVNGTWDGTDIIQTLVTGNGTVYLDNIFFSDSNTLGIDQFTTVSTKVFPNPTNSTWNVVSNQVISKIQLFDILGKAVITLEPNAAVTTIDAASIPKGMYFATLTTELGSETIKLIKN